MHIKMEIHILMLWYTSMFEKRSKSMSYIPFDPFAPQLRRGPYVPLFFEKKKFVRQSHVCVYIYTNMWICICVCVSVYVDIYIISYLYVGVYSVACIYICVYMNIYVCVCVYMCLHLDHVIYIWKCVQRMYVGVCSVATRILVYIYVYICIHIYKYQHTYKLHFVALLTCLCFLFLL